MIDQKIPLTKNIFSGILKKINFTGLLLEMVTHPDHSKSTIEDREITAFRKKYDFLKEVNFG